MKFLELGFSGSRLIRSCKCFCGGSVAFWFTAAMLVLGWFLGRWKWRRLASKREEIKRLMMRAAEEAVRVELEAASVYRSRGGTLDHDPAAEEPVVEQDSTPPVQRLQHQCEVCLSPNTRRCKQCKTVHYCSRKCQIFHWRQGHKDECHSVSTRQNIDPRFHSVLKELDPDGIETSQDGTQAMLNTKPVQSSSDNPEFGNHVKSLNLPNENCPPIFSTDTVASDTTFKVCDKHDLSEKPGLTTPKPGCVDVDEKPESSSLSDSEQRSLSKPSTSSDFWAGTAEPKKSDDVMKSNSCSSSLGNKTNASVEMLGSDMNRVQADDPCPDASVPRKPTALPETSEFGFKTKEPILKVTKLPSSNTSHDQLSEEGHVPRKSVDNVSRLQSLGPKVVDSKVDKTSDVFDSLKSQQKDYSSIRRSSAAHLPSVVFTKKSTTIPNVDASRSLDKGGCVQTSGSNRSKTTGVDVLNVSSISKPRSLGAGSWTMGRYEGSFPYELFVKLYNWNKFELRPSGLRNCGNSCYANAVLQCLTFTPPLTAYFLQGLHANTCRKKEWCFMCELEGLVKKAKEGNYLLSPARLLSQMKHCLGNGREEDAHEFLRYAIDAMQVACIKDAPVHAPNSLDDEDTTLLGLTFGGYLQSKIECMRCGRISRQRERIMDLTIEIGGEIRSLEDGLRHFTRSEILDGENKYRCERCKSYERAKKKLRVHEAPNILTIALKRFQSGKFGKLNKSVEFPEFLNLASYMRGTSDKSPIYQLYGAVVHLDVSNATFTGHYVCYVKNNLGRWFKADDSLVESVEIEKVLSKDAYMLFYSRCSPRAPKPIRSSLAPSDTRRASKELTSMWDFSTFDLDKGIAREDRKGPRSSSEDEERAYSLFSESGSHSTVSSTDESAFDLVFDRRGVYSTASSSPSSVSSPVRTRRSVDGGSSLRNSSSSVSKKVAGITAR